MTGDARVQAFRHGNEREPVVVIDGFASDPDALVAAAAGSAFSSLSPHYPGVQAPADAAYLAAGAELLEQVLRSHFDIQSGVGLVSCSYSLVTTPPAQLTAVQRLPHFDTTEPGRIALLHFLCGPEHGGTGFYRHRATGFETVIAARFADYRRALEDEARAWGVPPADYVRGDTRQFELVATYPAAFNRVLLYRSMTLHSGAIPHGHDLSGDPRRGRLTLNTFFAAKP